MGQGLRWWIILVVYYIGTSYQRLSTGHIKLIVVMLIGSFHQWHKCVTHAFYNHYVHLEINYKSGFVFIFASNPCYLTASEIT